MWSDKIYIEEHIFTSINFLDKNILTKVHSGLNLIKPVTYYFITDEEMIELNKQVLNHNYYTDIITFDYEDDDDIEHNEIIISVDRVMENAKTEAVTFKEELYRVCIHGLLHLSGLDDQTEEEKQKMRSQENHYLTLHCST